VILALTFLTRIPLRDRRPFTPERLRRAAFWFPAVGLLVGGVLGGTRALADLVLAPGPATVLALTAAVLVTGGFHEDGLADAADGLGAHVPRERKLEILKDSRVGTYGSLAVVLPLLFAYSVLSELSVLDCLRAAVAGHVLGRWSTLPHSLLIAPARTGSSATLVRASAPLTAAATAYTAAIVLLVAGLVPGLVALAVATLVTAVAGGLMARVLGGVTGDTFGAVNKLVEVTTYAALAAVWAA
jgi:adenosylcobinamide-GDP ribazoletransferase